MAFTKSKNLTELKNLLVASGGSQTQLTNEQTQFSFAGTRYVVNVYTTGTVTSQGEANAERDKLLEAQILSTNAIVQAKFQTEVKC